MNTIDLKREKMEGSNEENQEKGFGVQYLNLNNKKFVHNAITDPEIIEHTPVISKAKPVEEI